MAKDVGRFNLQGFKWGKSWIPKTFLDDANVAPVFWDPDLTDIPDSYWQTGIGGETDLKYQGFAEELSVISSGLNADGDYIYGSKTRDWRPVVNHGHYFFGQQYHYMFSDGGTIDYFKTADTDVANSANRLQFTHVPKPGVPIIARQWERVSSADLKVYREFAKVAYFQGSYSGGVEQDTWDEDTGLITWANVDRGDGPVTVTSGEMMVIYNVVPEASGQVIVSGILNNDYIFDVGSNPVTSGIWDALYNLGASNGEPFQQFNLPYAPVESGTLHVYVYNSGVMPTPSASEEFTLEESWDGVGWGTNKCIADRDMGTLYFGNDAGSGVIPSGNYEVGVYYRCNVGVEYERENTTDLVTGWETALEQLKKANNKNFLILAEGLDDPESITLTADLPTMSPTYGPLKIGNNFSILQAEVLDSNDTPLENIDISFYFTTTNQSIGGLGAQGSKSSSSFTNSDGCAYARLLSPSTIYDLGEYVNLDNAVPSGTLHLNKIQPQWSTLDDIYTYTVSADDEVLGIYQVDGTGNYDRDANLDPFFAGRGNFTVNSGTYEHPITGPTYVDSGVDNRLTGYYSFESGSPSEMWERIRRAPWTGMEDVAEFTADETSGRKKIISAWDTDAINPHTGNLGAYVPLVPSGILDLTSTSSGIWLSYPGATGGGTPTLPQIDSGVIPSGIHGYFVVGPALVSIQAKAYNQRTNSWLYSNEIDVLIDVGEEGRGTYWFDTVNTLPSGVLGSGITTAATSGLIPFGWRLPSTNPLFTVAGALDRMTFIDIN